MAGTDAKQVLARAGQLNARKSSLDGLPVERLQREAQWAYDEATQTVSEAVADEPWYVSLVPLALLATRVYSRSRYKSAIEKLGYAKSWLDNAKSAQSDQIRRIALKQAFSDSAHAIQLVGEEASKGSAADTAITAAKSVIQEEVEAVRGQFLIGAAIVAGILILANRRRD